MLPSPTGPLGDWKRTTGASTLARRLLAGRNLLKAWLLLAGTCAVLGGIGWILGGYRLLSVFVFSGLLLGLAVYWTADRAVLGLLRARELPVGGSPGLHAIVEGLARRAHVPKPRLYVVDTPYPYAATVRGARGPSIAVTTGLLAVLPPAELEGVMAHEVAHVRHRDATVQTTAVVIASTLVELSRIGGFLQRALLFVLGPVASAFVHALLSPKREFSADYQAARLCDSPHGLADALVRLEQASDAIEFEANPVTEPLYPVNPFAEEGLARLFVTHPPVPERVRRLRALDPGPGERLRAA
jgi:heat shock protein HtpX